MLLYSLHRSPRLSYTIEFLNLHFLEKPIQITADLKLFESFEGPRINYSQSEIDHTYQIVPEGLLFETDIRSEIPQFSNKREIPQLFSNDPLSSIFYCLSRYEEYQIEDRDIYGRFLSKHSLAAQFDLLEKPIVDIWVKMLVEDLESTFECTLKREIAFSYLCTFDIDVAFAYKGRPIWRTIAATLKNIIQVDQKQLFQRKKVLWNKEKDPYDTYSFQKEIIQKYDLDALYFFHVGDWAKFDKQIHPKSHELRQLINEVSQFAQVGIHPSYRAGERIELVRLECNRLETLTGLRCIKSRMHYLKLHIPLTYRMLNELGIMEDHTMGFADHPGFRAGTSFPFKFFDLLSNEVLDIKVVPLSVMDSSFIFYLNRNSHDSLDQIKRIINEVKAVNGCFVSLWHNQSLSDDEEWKGWKNLFIEMVEYISNGS